MNRENYLAYKRAYYQVNKHQWTNYRRSHQNHIIKWRIENKEKLREQNRKWQSQHREQLRAACRKYSRVNRDKLREYRQRRLPLLRERQRIRRQTDVVARLTINLQNRIRDALRNNRKSVGTAILLGCSVDSFKIYIESKFEPGMTWENYGHTWHLDHIVPCAIFDLSRKQHQKRCFHFSNYQPLFAEDNMSKKDKTDGQFILL